MNIINAKFKLLYTASFLSLAFFVGLICKLNVVGYETSFYVGVPLWYYLFPVISLSIINYTFLLKNVYPRFLFILFSIFLSSIIPLLWNLKYGRFYGFGDIYVHLNTVKMIADSGHISNELIYPVLHIYVSIISILTESDPKLIFLGFNFIIFSLYISLIYIICGHIFSTDCEVFMATIFGILSPFVITSLSIITPFIFSEILLIFIFYIMLKINNENLIQWHILILLFGFSIVTSHLMTGFLLLSILISYCILNKLFRMDNNSFSSLISNMRYYTNYMLLLSVFLFFWIYLVNQEAQHLFDGMISTLHNSFFQKDLSIEQTSITTRSPIDFLFKRFNLITESTLVFLSCSCFFYDILKGKSKYQEITSLAVYIFICFLCYIFITRFASQEFGVSGRYISYAALLYPPFLTYLFTRIIKYKDKARYLTLIFIICLFFGSLIAQYPRSEFGYYNAYTTDNSVSGLEWGYAHLNWNNSKIMGGGDHFESLSLYLIGSETYPTFKGSTNGLIDFLGGNSTLYEHRGVHDKYMVNDRRQYIYYEPLMSYFVANPKFASGVFSVREYTLSQNTILDEIYCNGAFTAYCLK